MRLKTGLWSACRAVTGRWWWIGGGGGRLLRLPGAMGGGRQVTDEGPPDGVGTGGALGASAAISDRILWSCAQPNSVCEGRIRECGVLTGVAPLQHCPVGSADAPPPPPRSSLLIHLWRRCSVLCACGVTAQHLSLPPMPLNHTEEGTGPSRPRRLVRLGGPSQSSPQGREGIAWTTHKSMSPAPVQAWTHGPPAPSWAIQG